MDSPRKPNGANGRDAGGRFALGNAGGPGNPYARKVAQVRATLMRAVKLQDIKAIVQSLIERAKNGDVVAAREVLDRILGKSMQAIELTGDSLATTAIRADVQIFIADPGLAQAAGQLSEGLSRIERRGDVKALPCVGTGGNGNGQAQA